jgi:hypothetical protein
MQTEFKIDLIQERGFIAYISAKYSTTDRMYQYTWENPTEEAKNCYSVNLNSKIKLGYIELTEWIKTIQPVFKISFKHNENVVITGNYQYNNFIGTTGIIVKIMNQGANVWVNRNGGGDYNDMIFFFPYNCLQTK